MIPLTKCLVSVAAMFLLALGCSTDGPGQPTPKIAESPDQPKPKVAADGYGDPARLNQIDLWEPLSQAHVVVVGQPGALMVADGVDFFLLPVTVERVLGVRDTQCVPADGTDTSTLYVRSSLAAGNTTPIVGPKMGRFLLILRLDPLSESEQERFELWDECVFTIPGRDGAIWLEPTQPTLHDRLLPETYSVGSYDELVSTVDRLAAAVFVNDEQAKQRLRELTDTGNGLQRDVAQRGLDALSSTESNTHEPGQAEP